MSTSNVIIEVDDGRIFCGWNCYGEVVIKPKGNKHLAYRMSRPLAERTIPKVERAANNKCHVTMAI